MSLIVDKQSEKIAIALLCAGVALFWGKTLLAVQYAGATGDRHTANLIEGLGNAPLLVMRPAFIYFAGKTLGSPKALVAVMAFLSIPFTGILAGLPLVVAASSGSKKATATKDPSRDKTDKKRDAIVKIAPILADMAFGQLPSTPVFSGADMPAVRRELAHCTIFAIDLAIQQSKLRDDLKADLSAEYWRHVTAARVDGSPVSESAKELLIPFAQSLQEPSPMGYSYQIGKVVAHRCGSNANAAVILLGAKRFSVVFHAALDILQKVSTQ